MAIEIAAANPARQDPPSSTGVATVAVLLRRASADDSRWSAELLVRNYAGATVTTETILLDTEQRSGVPEALKEAILEFFRGRLAPHPDDLAWFEYEIDRHSIRVSPLTVR